MREGCTFFWNLVTDPRQYKVLIYDTLFCYSTFLLRGRYWHCGISMLYCYLFMMDKKDSRIVPAAQPFSSAPFSQSLSPSHLQDREMHFPPQSYLSGGHVCFAPVEARGLY